jgi:hypothetical protein
MPNPPKSRDTHTHSVRTLSKTTPLKRYLSETQAHNSTPQPKVSTCYEEITIDASEKFVGPMAVELFLSDFVPKAPKERPTNKSVFAHSSILQKENEFASFSTLKHDSILTLIPDTCYRGMWPLSPIKTHQINYSTR